MEQPRKLASPRTFDIAAALFGFLLNVVGALGGPVYLAPAQRAQEALSLEIALQSARSKMILAANGLDNLAENLGALVFSVNAAADAPAEVGAAMHELRRRALDHRHDGVRGYVAELAVAGAVDFKSAARKYEDLVAAERADFNIDTFRAANLFESDLATRMVAAQGDAALKAIDLQEERTRARQVVVDRGLILFLITTTGSTLVFLATMAATGQKPPEPESIGAERLPGAIRLLEEARTLLGAQNASAQGERA